ncbi:MAG: SlyX family protein [Planctomycetota bacterium]
MSDDRTVNAITALEERSMFLEKHVDDLDGAVRDVNGDIAGLRREIAALRTLLRRMTERLDTLAEDEPDADAE